MNIINSNKLDTVSGGYMFIVYPVVGCGVNTGLTYLREPDSSYQDLGRGCLKGAIHGMNPGFNAVGSVITNPVGRYAVGIAYGYASGDVADFMMPRHNNQSSDTCPFAFGND